MDEEIWKPIPGFEGSYEISDKGRVKSLARVAVGKKGKTRTVEEYILKPAAEYRLAHPDGKGEYFKVANLVHNLFSEGGQPTMNIARTTKKPPQRKPKPSRAKKLFKLKSEEEQN